MVEGDEGAVEGEGGERRVRGRVPVGDPLEEAHRVPGQVAHRPAGEAGQAGDLDRRRPEPRAQERGEETARLQVRLFAFRHHDTLRPRLERRHGIAPEERVAGQPLAAHDALQQEGPLRSRGEGEEGGDGGAQVARELRGRRARAHPAAESRSYSS